MTDYAAAEPRASIEDLLRPTSGDALRQRLEDRVQRPLGAFAVQHARPSTRSGISS